jgi:bifunctional non-homologous end joining protein LigD
VGAALKKLSGAKQKQLSTGTARIKPPLPKPSDDLDLTKLPKAEPGFVEPMKAKLVENLPRGEDWIYEIKFDGIRALAVKNGKSVQLISRNKKLLNERFPTVAQAVAALDIPKATLDGEVVALDARGRSSFQLLQSQNLFAEAPNLYFYVFDILNYNGRDARKLFVPERKQLLRLAVPEDCELLRFSGAIPGDADAVAKSMQGLGLEGIIAKWVKSPYETGKRSGAWAKFKWTSEQEFVIGGYTDPEGARPYFGALLVGYYSEGKLLFATKVGTGFDARLLASLHKKFQRLGQAGCPFANLPELRNIAGRQGIGRAEMRRCHWVRPELVCQIRFTEWTRDNHLRHPVFLGLREDKSAREVVRETPSTTSAD